MKKSAIKKGHWYVVAEGGYFVPQGTRIKSENPELNLFLLDPSAPKTTISAISAFQLDKTNGAWATHADPDYLRPALTSEIPDPLLPIAGDSDGDRFWARPPVIIIDDFIQPMPPLQYDAEFSDLQKVLGYPLAFGADPTKADVLGVDFRINVVRRAHDWVVRYKNYEFTGNDPVKLVRQAESIIKAQKQRTAVTVHPFNGGLCVI
jgi:hypothetical protein